MMVWVMVRHLVLIVLVFTMGIRISYIGLLLMGLVGILKIMEMATATALQNLILIFFPPLILYNYDSGAHIPSFLGYPHGMCASLLLDRSLLKCTGVTFKVPLNW